MLSDSFMSLPQIDPVMKPSLLSLFAFFVMSLTFAFNVSIP